MNGGTAQNVVRYLLIGVIVVSVALLGWWYFFLKRETVAEQAIDRARGLDASIPEFSEPAGNTYLNLVRSLPSTPLWRSVRDAVPRVGDSFSSSRSEDEAEVVRPRLWQANALPTAGFGFVVEGGTTTLRFVERATGNVLSSALTTNVVSRLTNTLVPGVEEAFFAGERVFMRVAEGEAVTTKTALVRVGEKGAQPLRVAELEERMLSFAVAPGGKGIAYLLGEASGGLALSTAGADGKNGKRILSLGTRDWRVQYGGAAPVLVLRAADDMAGYAYRVSTKGVLVPIVRAKPGLAVSTHASSSALLWSTSEKGALSLFVQTDDGAPTRLPLNTIAEKCAFAPNGRTAYCAVPRGTPGEQFLDRWYRGETHTSDSWWVVDVERGTAKELFDPEFDADVSLDAELPVVSDDGVYLAFRNARDWSLWVLSLQ